MHVVHLANLKNPPQEKFLHTHGTDQEIQIGFVNGFLSIEVALSCRNKMLF